MISEFEIKNYKSIKDCTIELGKFNVFIGENGCGKSNILEAFAMASIASLNEEITTEELYNKGVRVANPSLTFNSFKKKKLQDHILLKVKTIENFIIKSSLKVKDIDSIYSNWINLENSNKENINNNFLKDYLIYNIETKALRGIIKESLKQPLGINGEGLDILISSFDKNEFEKLKEHAQFISWLDNILVDEKDTLKFQGHKLGKSTSRLYFKDKFMSTKNNVFSAENANEGILHVLFYLTLFISKRTPSFFAIDNIEKSLNPKLCRNLIKELAKIAKENDKQTLITTHNPAILDGLNLNDDEQRLFVVSRTDEGYTKVERIKVKPDFDNEKDPKYKLSEMWMRGYLGGIPNNF